jgi:hypothetical protein
MWGKKTKRDKCDALFSNYIRTRDKWQCQYCGKTPNKQGLHCSHYYSRARESTRFDPENAVALCFSCHNLIGHSSEYGGVYKEFMIKRLGKKGFDLLTLRAYTPKKKDRKMTFLILKEMMKDLEEKD